MPITSFKQKSAGFKASPKSCLCPRNSQLCFLSDLSKYYENTYRPIIHLGKLFLTPELGLCTQCQLPHRVTESLLLCGCTLTSLASLISGHLSHWDRESAGILTLV